MRNYRPSELLERIVLKRLQIFLDGNDMMPATKSAYRQFHGTETIVTKVYGDLLLAADEGLVSALCLLDLTAAFDTVDHDLLLLHFERQFGIRGPVLQWVVPLLSVRQVISSCVLRKYIVNSVHPLLSAPEVSIGSAFVYTLHSRRRSTRSICTLAPMTLSSVSCISIVAVAIHLLAWFGLKAVLRKSNTGCRRIV